MKTKHTPGPWWVQDNTVQFAGGQLRVDSDDGAIAECGRYPNIDPELKANANLIAAAPDLLEALNALADGVHLKLREKDMKPLMKKALAVIKKATSRNT